jgi:hypothetical protein
MDMLVGVRLRRALGVLVPMLLVREVGVGVDHLLVAVGVRVPLRQEKVGADSHQRGGRDHDEVQVLAEQRYGYRRPYERADAEERAGASGPQRLPYFIKRILLTKVVE